MSLDPSNCSKEISGEHYFSAALLRQIGDRVMIAGVPWLPENQWKQIGVSSLTANILCARHNSALAPLDCEAAIFSEAANNAVVDLARKTLSRKPRFGLASGEALQLWGLKLACGIFFGGIANKKGTRLVADHTLDINKVLNALFEGRWDDRAGLYFRAASGDKSEDIYAFSSLSDPKTKRMVGVTVQIRGLAMDVLFDSEGANPGPWTALVKSPTQIRLVNGSREHSIILTWPPGTPENCINLERS